MTGFPDAVTNMVVYQCDLCGTMRFCLQGELITHGEPCRCKDGGDQRGPWFIDPGTLVVWSEELI